MPLTPSTTDLFLKVGVPGTATTLAAPGYTIGNASINVGSTSNWSTDTPVIFAIDNAQVVNGVATRIAGSYCEFFGIVSSATSIGNLTLKYGSAQNYVAGSLTRVYIPVTGSRENMLIDGLNQDHNGRGNHKDLTGTNQHTVLGLTDVASAVNDLRATNAITGAAPSLNAEGSDTNIDTDMNAKGSGVAHMDGASPKNLANGGGQNMPWVESGCVITFTASTLNWSMTAGVVWVNGKRYYVAAASGTTTASKDIYFDILVGATRATTSQTLVNTGVNVVANGAASPALAANSIRIGKMVAGVSITSIQQWGVDAVTTAGQLNYIYNTSPTAAPIFAYTNAGNAGGTYYYRNQNGVKEFWGTTASLTTNSTYPNYNLNLPTSFFNSIQIILPTVMSLSATGDQLVNLNQGVPPTTTTIVLGFFSGAAGTAVAGIYVRGF